MNHARSGSIRQSQRLRGFGFGLNLLAWILVSLSSSALANVYPTKLQLNGGYGSLLLTAGEDVVISYVLNEPASAGVTIIIRSNTTAFRTITLSSGEAGTMRGHNQIVWNGHDDTNLPFSPGTYSIHVTAASLGHAEWSPIPSNNPDGSNYIYAPTGIAVNRNPSSPHYGRVFVANAIANPGGFLRPGDGVGLIKANADGSLAEEGGFSDGGWPWAGDFYSPWKVEVSADDFVYVNDWTTNGIVLRFDQEVSPASRKMILRPDNWPNLGQAVLAGPAIAGNGANIQIWMADITPAPEGVGIRRFALSPDGSIASDDLGATAVQTGGDSDLTDFPYDVALDGSNRIYTIQFETRDGYPNNRVLRFPAHANGHPPLTNADWKIGSGDNNLRSVYGISVSADGSLVAVALGGVGSGITRSGGGVRVFNTSNGAEVVSLSPVTPASWHDHTDVAWDSVGNLYACDFEGAVWRAYSPPGSNYATTVALAHVQILGPLEPPGLTATGYEAGEFQFTLCGQAQVTYAILSSTNLLTWTAVATNTAATAMRTISLPAPAPFNFFRAVVAP